MIKIYCVSTKDANKKYNEDMNKFIQQGKQPKIISSDRNIITVKV